MAEIARKINPILRGWNEYYGRYTPSALASIFLYVNQTLHAWMMRKFKRFKGHKARTWLFLEKLNRERAELFVHWQYDRRRRRA